MILSIITVNKNNDAGLEKTAQSILWQTFKDFEWIVIDGASNDKSVDIIKKYSNNLKYWVSEPDNGIYHAMNKGVLKSNGEYCLFLNSGDWLLCPDSLENAFNIINNSENADIYYSDGLRSDFSLWEMPKKLTIDHLYIQAALIHQSTFIKRKLFFEHEFYDERFLTVSDSIFFLREFIIYHTKFLYINVVLSVYSIGGISSTDKTAKSAIKNEIKKLLSKNAFRSLIIKHFFRKTNYIKKIIKNILPYGIVKLIKYK